MGGAILGHISFQEIYAFLSLGMSTIPDPVNVYAGIMKAIDAEYVAIKQKKLDDEVARASKSSGKGGKGGKQQFMGAPPQGGKLTPLPHNID